MVYKIENSPNPPDEVLSSHIYVYDDHPTMIGYSIVFPLFATHPETVLASNIILYHEQVCVW